MPREVSVHVESAYDLLWDYKPEQAESIFQEVLELSPGHPDAMAGMGAIFYLKGMFEEALSWFRSVILSNPDHERALAGEIAALIRMGKVQAARDISVYRLKKHKESSRIWHRYGHVLEEMKDINGAKLAFEKSIDMNPDRPCFKCLGIVLNKMGEHIKAINYFDKAIKFDPEDVVAWMGKGDSLRALDMISESNSHTFRAIFLSMRKEKYFAHINTIKWAAIKFLKQGSSLLLCFRLISSHADLGVLEGLGASVLEIERTIRPYGLSLVEMHRGSSATYWALRAVGLLAFNLGDPFEAQRHFDALDTEDDTDLLGQFYLVQSYDAYLETTMADAVMGVALERASVVHRTRDTETPEALYYAGLLFRLGDNRLKALQCFRAAAEQGDLAALYMAARTANQLEQVGEEDRVYRQIAQIELDRRAKASGAKGFLVPYEAPVLDFEDPRWIDEILHMARVSEVQGAVEGFYEWLDRQRQRSLEARTAGRLDEVALFYNPDWHVLDDFRYQVENENYRAWQRMVTTEASRAQIAEHIEALGRKEVKELGAKARERFPDALRFEGTSEELEARIGEQILHKSTLRGFTWGPFHDLALYLAAIGKLEPRAVLRLTVFARLSSPEKEAHKELAEEAVRGALSQYMTASGAGSLITLAVGPMLGPASALVAGASGGFLVQLGVQLARRLRSKEIVYPYYADYKGDFEDHLFELVGGAGLSRIDRLLGEDA